MEVFGEGLETEPNRMRRIGQAPVRERIPHQQVAELVGFPGHRHWKPWQQQKASNYRNQEDADNGGPFTRSEARECRSSRAKPLLPEMRAKEGKGKHPQGGESLDGGIVKATKGIKQHGLITDKCRAPGQASGRS